MICGIVGIVISLFVTGLLPAVAAIILGHVGAKREPHAKSMWLTGLITGYVGIVISVIRFVALLFIFLPAFTGSNFNFQ